MDVRVVGRRPIWVVGDQLGDVPSWKHEGVGDSQKSDIRTCHPGDFERDEVSYSSRAISWVSMSGILMSISLNVANWSITKPIADQDCLRRPSENLGSKKGRLEFHFACRKRIGT
jgi:hypothetical protein